MWQFSFCKVWYCVSSLLKMWRWFPMYHRYRQEIVIKGTRTILYTNSYRIPIEEVAHASLWFYSHSSSSQFEICIDVRQLLLKLWSHECTISRVGPLRTPRDGITLYISWIHWTSLLYSFVFPESVSCLLLLWPLKSYSLQKS